MLSPSVAPRTTSVTLRACACRCSAAWPAELPAPTTNTSRPAIPRASETDAP